MSSTSSIFQQDINTYLLFRQRDFQPRQQTDNLGKTCFNGRRTVSKGSWLPTKCRLGCLVKTCFLTSFFQKWPFGKTSSPYQKISASNGRLPSLVAYHNFPHRACTYWLSISWDCSTVLWLQSAARCSGNLPFSLLHFCFESQTSSRWWQAWKLLIVKDALVLLNWPGDLLARPPLRWCSFTERIITCSALFTCSSLRFTHFPPPQNVFSCLKKKGVTYVALKYRIAH